MNKIKSVVLGCTVLFFASYIVKQELTNRKIMNDITVIKKKFTQSCHTINRNFGLVYAGSPKKDIFRAIDRTMKGE